MIRGSFFTLQAHCYLYFCSGFFVPFVSLSHCMLSFWLAVLCSRLTYHCAIHTHSSHHALVCCCCTRFVTSVVKNMLFLIYMDLHSWTKAKYAVLNIHSLYARSFSDVCVYANGLIYPRPDCKQWVQTSMSSQLPPWHPGWFSSLSSHWGSRKCIKASIAYHKPMLDRTASYSLVQLYVSFIWLLIIMYIYIICLQTSLCSLTYTCMKQHLYWSSHCLARGLDSFIMLCPWEHYHNGPDAFVLDVIVY